MITKNMMETKDIEENDNILDSNQVAKLIGLSVRTIQMWAVDGNIPAFRVKRFWRYYKDVVIKGIAEGKYKVKIDNINLKKELNDVK